MNIYDVVSVLAIVVGPIVAVVITHRLQVKKGIRDDKMQIFKTLMTARIYPWTPAMVDSLNIIDIVFADDKKVREAWKDLFDKYNVSNCDESHLKKVQIAQYKLLQSIADSLGYKDKVTWETIQNPYIPRGMQEQIDAQNRNQMVYSSLIETVKDSLPKQ